MGFGQQGHDLVGITTGLISSSSQSSHLPLIRIYTISLFAWDVAYMWQFVRVFLAGQPFDFPRRICNKQLPTGCSDILATIQLEDAEFLSVVAQPHHVAFRLQEYALE